MAYSKDYSKRVPEYYKGEKRPLQRTFKKIDPGKLKPHVTEHCDDTLSEIAEAFNCSIRGVDGAVIDEVSNVYNVCAIVSCLFAGDNEDNRRRED